MFLTCCTPRSSKRYGSRPTMWSWTAADMQIPPGSARPSSRAATLTPSPKMSSGSTITSPTLMPMRKANALILAGIGVALCHFELNFGGATHGVDHTDKLCQQFVACRFDNVTAVLAYLRVDQITEMGLQ